MQGLLTVTSAVMNFILCAGALVQSLTQELARMRNWEYVFTVTLLLAGFLFTGILCRWIFARQTFLTIEFYKLRAALHASYMLAAAARIGECTTRPTCTTRTPHALAKAREQLRQWEQDYYSKHGSRGDRRGVLVQRVLPARALVKFHISATKYFHVLKGIICKRNLGGLCGI